jgi:DNA-binding CsgD family transcriptional regulator
MGAGGGDPLLERGEEIDALRLHLDWGSRDGGLAVIAGAAGIGKTRLLKAVRAEAVDLGLRVLTARCSALERDFAFGVARQVFEPLLGEPSARAALDGAAAAAAPLFAGTSHVAGGAPPDPSYAVLDGLHRLALAIAGGGAVVLVDDLQWCDEPSLRWLAYSTRRLAGTRLGVIATLARGAGNDGARIERELADDPAALVITPRPLSERAAGDLLVVGLRRMPEPGFVRACHELSAGNPLVLSELVRDLVADGLEPLDAHLDRLHELGRPSVARSVLGRLQHLPAPAIRLAGALAVLSDGEGPVELELAAELAGLDPTAARQAAALLREAGILAPDGRDFVHGAVRETIYAEIAPGERARQHLRAARRLDASGAGAGRVGQHLLATEPGSDDAAWVVGTLRAAARDAIERGVPDEAARLLRRALADPRTPGPGHLAAELGRAEAVAGEHAAASHLRAAMDEAGDGHERLGLAGELARTLVLAGRPLEATARLRDALAVSARGPADAPGELVADAEAELAVAERLGRTPPAAAPGRLGADAAAAPGDEATAHVLDALNAFEAAAAGGVPAGGTARGPTAPGGAAARVTPGGSDPTRTAGRLLAERGPLAPAVLLLGAALVAGERDDEAARVLDMLGAAAARHGAPVPRALAGALRAELHLRRGAVAEAEAAARAALAIVPRAGLAPLVRALVERGDLDAADAALSAAGLAGSVPDDPLLDPVLLVRGLLRAAQGRPEPAVTDLLLCGSRQLAWGAPSPGLLAWRSHAAAQLALLGETRRAQALAAEELALARAPGTPRALGVALRGAGLAAHGAQAIELLREAVGTLAGARATLEHAHALVALGAAVRRDGRRVEARHHLVRGQELAERCGAWALVSRARQELVTAGARPRRARVSGVQGLTASERRAAELAAGGRSNREIASALYLTPKTIEMHLSSAYRKLDIRSRAQLPDVLGPWNGFQNDRGPERTVSRRPEPPDPSRRLAP